MEECWAQAPSVRPHAADILALFETASHGWASPTSEAIANLSFGHRTNPNSPVIELADLTLETVFGTTGGGTVGPPEAGQSPPTPNGEQGTDTVWEAPLTPRSAIITLFSCIIRLFS